MIRPGWDSSTDNPGQSSGIAPPPLAESAYLNANLEAAYAGSHTCAECHQDQHASFQLTAHSEALAEVDVASEPPDVEFHHATSGRSYRVYRDEDEFRHQEFVKLDAGEELVLADYPMTYVIGSGAYSRSYLVDIDGFLVESPVTWYAESELWGMSPGYDDNPFQQGFSRPTTFKCVLCHAGRIEPIEGSLHRLTIHEQVIGCENCHGPGALHVQSHREDLQNVDQSRTIVNPSKLPRALSEDVCAVCHLFTGQQADVRDRHPSEFRPGLRLSDFVHHYRPVAEDDQMTVTGHMQQMRRSACWQNSEEFTCITCHAPHDNTPVTGRRENYRRICMDCHPGDSCTEPEENRLHRQPDNDCLACHMPETNTDIPHFAFNHHRVGIHELPFRPSLAGPRPATALPPTADLSDFSDADLKRSEAIAWAAFADSSTNPELRAQYVQRAADTLEALRDEEIRDSLASAVLATLYTELGAPQKAIEVADEALRSPIIHPEARLMALAEMARVLYESEQYEASATVLEKQVTVERSVEPWLRMSLCRARLDDHPGSVEAAKQAVQIEPHRVDLRIFLADAYSRNGQPQESEAERQVAATLKKRLPQRE